MRSTLHTVARQGTHDRRIAALSGVSSRVIVRPASSIGAKAPFDLYDRRLDRFKVRGFDLKNDGTNKLVVAAGVFRDVVAGSGGHALDADIVIGAARFVYLLDTITASGEASVHAVTLEVEDAIPDGGDTGAAEATLPIPLWYLPWDNANSRIDWTNLMPLRGLPVLPFAGN